MKIAFLGTGLMGGPMAKNLAVAGFQVTAWNRTSSKATFLKDFEVDIEVEPSDAVKNAEVIISMLSDGDASQEIQNDEKCNRVRRIVGKRKFFAKFSKANSG